MALDFKEIRTFNGGYVTDLVDEAEFKDTLQKGVNGRLYSHNGVLAYSSVKGTIEVMNDPDIVKYLGYFSFKDEMIVFVKSKRNPTNGGDGQGTSTTVLNAYDYSLQNFVPNTIINIGNSISENSVENVVITPPDGSTPSSETDFQLNYTCQNNDTGVTIDFAQYYQIDDTVPNLEACPIASNGSNIIPENNQLYSDAIISISKDENENIIYNYLWVGYQNWDINGKITTDGVEENQYYKRVYYTDVVNPLRVVNIKDPQLFTAAGSQFDTLLKTTLLQPEINSVISGGQLNAMKCLYTYRLISSNGQVTEFSPTSFFARTVPEDTAIEFRGGSVSEFTGKAIVVDCNILDFSNASEIQCVAIEFEAKGAPTAIRDLGRKPVSPIVQFTHFGNESIFGESITLSELLDARNTWKYANDLSSKKNKLVVAGLRNDPIPTEINNLEYLFPLHSWDENGNTHECILNPEPWNFRYIDPSFTGDFTYVKRKLYKSIRVLGNFTLTFENVNTGNSYSISFSDSTEQYIDYTADVLAWLISLQSSDPNFATYFPNLLIENAGGSIFFKPINDTVNTDMQDYRFTATTSQFLEDISSDVQFLPVNINTSNLVHGAVSPGFNSGNGIRISYRLHKDDLLKKANSVYDGTGRLLDYFTPTEKKGFHKGELYRLAFQAYDNDSIRLFSIPLGDIMIPEIGDIYTYISDNGNAVITGDVVLNQSVDGDILKGHRMTIKVEVRLSCELQQRISMYQILYVERTEDNRTILCQGISAPLNRVQYDNSNAHKMPDPVRNKWNLPYYGGPTYEKDGLRNYDTYGENHQYTGQSASQRTITHRGLMYFDSPDLYNSKISTQYVEQCRMQILGKINTDHTPDVIRESGQNMPTFGYAYGQEIYPKFSRKILDAQIEGNNNSDGFPKINDKSRDRVTLFTHFINVSVFPSFTLARSVLEIDKSRDMTRGEEVSGAAFNVQNDVSNNTFCLPTQPWYYGGYQRKWELDGGAGKSEIFRYAITSPGYKTVILKTKDDLFTDQWIGTPLPKVSPQIRLGGDGINVYDTLPIVNLYRDNRESVFGGRGPQSYASNTYIPLSRTIPVRGSSNGTQFFEVEGDTYTTLNIRTKNDYGDEEPFFSSTINNGGNVKADYSDVETWQREGAWAYVVVLETQVEPKLTYGYEFYKVSGTHSFETSRDEIINTAYFQENDFKPFIPKPFDFKDEPNLNNIVAVSETKLSGEFFDAWTLFKPANFYELEKNQGSVTNLAKQEEEIYAVQEHQTSLLYINRDELVNTTSGGAIGVQQGTGNAIGGHKVIAPFGTSIRRAVGESRFGFVFFDERKNEFVKMNTGLLRANNLHLNWYRIFDEDPVIDTEAYFDEEYKESNIRVRTKSGLFYTLSYNEILKKFNGWIEYNADLFMIFDEDVYAPNRINRGNVPDSSSLHQLNRGPFLNFFDIQKQLILGIVVNLDPNMVKIYKQTELTTNIRYNINQITAETSNGQTRTILGTHHWYRIREGQHTVPLKNEIYTIDSPEIDDLRGNRIYLEYTVDSINNTKVDIFAITIYMRKSYQ